MKIRNFFRSLVYSNIFISLGMSSIVLASVLIMSMPADIFIFLSPFLVTFSMYTLNRRTDIEEDMLNDRPRTNFIRRYKKHLPVLIVVSYIAAVLPVLIINATAASLLLVPLLFGIFYTIKIFPFSFSRLKEIPVVKNMIVALNWAILGVLFPVIYTNSSFSFIFVYMFIFIFIRVLIGAAFFDIRDVAGDMRERIRTIPIILGKQKTLKLLVILNTVSLFMIFFSPTRLSLLLVLPVLYGYIYLFLYKKIEIRSLCDYIVDGEYILIGLIIALGFFF